jgi:hypothetical protein
VGLLLSAQKYMGGTSLNKNFKLGLATFFVPVAALWATDVGNARTPTVRVVYALSPFQLRAVGRPRRTRKACVLHLRCRTMPSSGRN